MDVSELIKMWNNYHKNGLKLIKEAKQNGYHIKYCDNCFDLGITGDKYHHVFNDRCFKCKQLLKIICPSGCLKK